MSPNDQYLRIVPDRQVWAAPVNVMLPFEGDAVLSIILSKAFMLAEDKKIKEPTDEGIPEDAVMVVAEAALLREAIRTMPMPCHLL